MHHFTLAGLLTGILLMSVPGSASAQTLQGDLSPFNHPDYASIASHFLLENASLDGVSIFAGSGLMLCSDFEGTSLDEDPDPYSAPVTLGFGTLEDMDVWDRFSTPQDEALAIAQVHWLADNYYEDFFLNVTTDASAKQYAFQNVIWEIMYDGGTAAGLDWSTGHLDRDQFSNRRRYGPELWFYMTTLLDAVENSGVTASYQGTLPLYATLDSRPGYQDYILITADLAYPAIPEPGALALLFLGSLRFLRRGR